MLYAESARSFLFKRNTDVELDLSNDLLGAKPRVNFSYLASLQNVPANPTSSAIKIGILCVYFLPFKSS